VCRRVLFSTERLPSSTNSKKQTVAANHIPPAIMRNLLKANCFTSICGPGSLLHILIKIDYPAGRSAHSHRHFLCGNITVHTLANCTFATVSAASRLLDFGTYCRQRAALRLTYKSVLRSEPVSRCGPPKLGDVVAKLLHVQEATVFSKASILAHL
jgi:hypothetical protein